VPQRFEIITEADARVLTPGDSVELAPGGHITPLALDTLRERRITVVREGAASASDLSLAPIADIRKIAVASDHTGLALRKHIVASLRGRGLAVQDLGTESSAAVDYPDMALAVALAVVHQEADAGIVIDGAGIGSAIAANKVPGIRAATAASETIARYSREHNGANVLTLGATLLGTEEADRIVAVWLSTPMREPRYMRRLAKIQDIERRAERWQPGGRGRQL
jgi:ribose 5-phosphate isomerase B